MTGIRNDNLPSQNVPLQGTDGPARPAGENGTGKNTGHASVTIGNKACRVITQDDLQSDGATLAAHSTFEKAHIANAHQEFATLNHHPDDQHTISGSNIALQDRKISPIAGNRHSEAHMSFVTQSFMSATGNGDGFIAACDRARIDPTNLDDEQRELVDQRLSDLFAANKNAATPMPSDVSVLISKSAEVIRQIAGPQQTD
ncbi:hypothetical protein LPB41_01490 [Thalassospira sp. MA62]|nr:hypothetical protein [Thalassospira sp. MA62]